MLRLQDDETEFVRAQRRRIEPTTSMSATPLAEQMIEDLKKQQKRDRSRSRGRDEEPDAMEARMAAFMAERQAVSKDVKGNRRKHMLGKTLRYEHCDRQTQLGMGKSRAKEWNKWLDFGASVKLQGKVLDELLTEGHKPVPTQWVDTRKSDGSLKAILKPATGPRQC